MALEAGQRGQEVDTVGYGTHVSLISRICVLGHMQAMVEKRHAYLEPTPPGPAKSIVTMGTLIHVCFFSFSSSFLSLQSASYATFSAFTPVLSFYSTMHTCRTTFQDPCAHLFQVDLFQTTLLASCRRRACQA